MLDNDNIDNIYKEYECRIQSSTADHSLDNRHSFKFLDIYRQFNTGKFHISRYAIGLSLYGYRPFTSGFRIFA